jgi:hypothetical protein
VRAVAVLFAALLLAAPAGSATRSGLAGVVRLPKPVCLQDEPCDGAAPGVTLVFSRNGVVVRRVTSGERGRYRLALAAGLYSVSSPSAQPMGRVLPSRVRVYAGRFRQVDFFVDTGIRSPQ